MEGGEGNKDGCPITGRGEVKVLIYALIKKTRQSPRKYSSSYVSVSQSLDSGIVGGRGSRRLSIFVICSEDNDENGASVLSHRFDSSEDECQPLGIHPSRPTNGKKSAYSSRCAYKNNNSSCSDRFKRNLAARLVHTTECGTGKASAASSNTEKVLKVLKGNL